MLEGIVSSMSLKAFALLYMVPFWWEAMSIEPFLFFKDIHGCFFSALLAEIINSWNKRIKSSCRGNSIPPVYLPQLPSVLKTSTPFLNTQHQIFRVSLLCSHHFEQLFSVLFRHPMPRLLLFLVEKKKFVSHRTLKSTNTITHSVSQAYRLSSLSSVSSIVFTV